MEFVEQNSQFDLAIQSYHDDKIEISGQVYDYPIILNRQQVFRLPEKCVADLTVASFTMAVEAGARLIIIGTGREMGFLSPVVQVALAQRGVGVECMTTAAACRTLAMVQAEGRDAWAWLWLAN